MHMFRTARTRNDSVLKRLTFLHKRTNDFNAYVLFKSHRLM